MKTASCQRLLGLIGTATVVGGVALAAQLVGDPELKTQTTPRQCTAPWVNDTDILTANGTFLYFDFLAAAPARIAVHQVLGTQVEPDTSYTLRADLLVRAMRPGVTARAHVLLVGSDNTDRPTVLATAAAVRTNAADDWGHTYTAQYSSVEADVGKELVVVLLGDAAGLDNSSALQAKVGWDNVTVTADASTPSSADTAGSATNAAGTNRAATVTWRQMNEAFGLTLWRDRPLWEENDRDVGRRLRWPEESRTSKLSSYRLYATPTMRVLGARPYSLAMYGESGKPTDFSLIFANKGDYEGFAMGRLKRATATARTLREFKAAFEQDASTIEGRLRSLLGEPLRSTYGEKNLKEKSLRWDWNGHSILLAAPRDEYIGVRILTPAVADSQGRVAKVSDAELKHQLATNVVHRKNGDVLVTEIPMVDQGPKGFCVPATWERYLRYLGVPADMYVLAMVSDTMTGGGTRIDLMIDSIRSYVTRCGRTIQPVQATLKPIGVQKYIDHGLPLMWALRTSEALADVLTTRAKQREQVTDWAQWKASLKEARHNAHKTAIACGDGLHMCMIIGYNKDTDEIAVSDSWGPEFAERWITMEEADALSLGELLVVSW